MLNPMKKTMSVTKFILVIYADAVLTYAVMLLSLLLAAKTPNLSSLLMFGYFCLIHVSVIFFLCSKYYIPVTPLKTALSLTIAGFLVSAVYYYFFPPINTLGEEIWINGVILGVIAYYPLRVWGERVPH